MNDEKSERPLLPGPEWFEEHPFRRLSHTRIAVWKRCPRWYAYRYLEWAREPTLAVQRGGQAVQAAVEAVLLQPAPTGADLAGLHAWAEGELRLRFAPEWEARARDHAEDPNALDAFELDRERSEGWALQGVRWHLLEVEARLAGRHPRTHEPLDLPPVADATQAWEEVRPVIVTAREDGHGVMEVIPEGWYQGEIDLVYTWTGGRRLVDLKACADRGAFAPEVVHQLHGYAFMDLELGRGRPAGLEAWFLGEDSPRVIPLPSPEEVEAFRAEALDLLEATDDLPGGSRPDPGRFPAQPAPLAEGEWCAICPFSTGCSAARTSEGTPDDVRPTWEEIARGGGGREVGVEGTVIAVGPARRGKRPFWLANGSGLQAFRWKEEDTEALLRRGLRAGRRVRLLGLRTWQTPDGERVLLFAGRRLRMEILEPGEGPGEDRTPGVRTTSGLAAVRRPGGRAKAEERPAPGPLQEHQVPLFPDP